MSRSLGIDYAADAEEELQMRSTCTELKKEKEMLRQSLLLEKSIHAELIRRLNSDANATSEAHFREKKYIEELERELNNCSQEIEYLQDQLNLRNVEANCLGEHVHCLELKLTDVEKLNERIRLLSEELNRSDRQQLILMQELKSREEELQNSMLHIEKLEDGALDAQCEIESMKLDMTSLEQRCLQAESSRQHAVQETARMAMQLKEFDIKFQEAQQVIRRLENENKKLHENFVISERNVRGSFFKLELLLEKWLEQINRFVPDMPNESTQTLLLKLWNEILLTKEMGTIEEVLVPFLSKLSVVRLRDESIKDEIEMPNKIHESERLVKHLKEELREEKLKAKEEAEDLIQEMAELRYQIMGMLEEESKRRACIEQASIQRIQELEAQVQEEQNKYTVALRQYEETREIAERRSIEVRRLKNTLKGFQHGVDKETTWTIDPCNSEACISLQTQPGSLTEAFADDEVLNITGSSNALGRALVEWTPDKSYF